MLAAFDEQMRRHPVAGPGMRVEAEDRLTRTVGTDGSWAAVVWSDLTETDADEAIAAERARATGALEWKLYSHDRAGNRRAAHLFVEGREHGREIHCCIRTSGPWPGQSSCQTRVPRWGHEAADGDARAPG